jgi:hypothetical protein
MNEYWAILKNHPNGVDSQVIVKAFKCTSEYERLLCIVTLLNLRPEIDDCRFTLESYQSM